jgi:predicted nucleic acid-binding protein
MTATACLADTNILLRMANRADREHAAARNAVRELRRQGHILHVTTQNLVEFRNVITRPITRNGMGMSSDDADRQLRLMERVFDRLPDTDDVYERWRELVRVHAVLGVQVHDTRLVAAMLVHGVTRILTFNGGDFIRYAGEGLTVIDPATI